MKAHILFFLLFLSSVAFSEESKSTLSSLKTLEQTLNVPYMGWLQKGERWNFQNWEENKRSEILPILDKLGYLQGKQAQEKVYRYGMVIGALYAAVQTRIDFLIAEWNRGVRFESIVFLTGQRKLIPKKEPLEGLKTEAEMMAWVWNHAKMPAKLRERPLVVLDTKTPPFLTRPNTFLAAQTWLAQSPEPGTCLVVSSQPYLNYQHHILRMILPQTFKIEMVGPATYNNMPISVLLDTVARTECMKKGFLIL